MRPAFFWVVTGRIAAIPYQSFGTTFRSHLQGLRNPREKLLGFLDPWIWDRKFVPKLWSGITAIRRATTQKNAELTLHCIIFPQRFQHRLSWDRIRVSDTIFSNHNVRRCKMAKNDYQLRQPCLLIFPSFPTGCPPAGMSLNPHNGFSWNLIFEIKSKIKIHHNSFHQQMHPFY
jgi:hypothetical protein